MMLLLPPATMLLLLVIPPGGEPAGPPPVSSVVTLFSAEKGVPHVVVVGDCKINSYGNTLSLLLVPPSTPSNRAVGSGVPTLIAATRANAHSAPCRGGAPILRR
eukprot:SAG31_NODE_36653_length_311_cov_0.976415_1_plen_103_part_11